MLPSSDAPFVTSVTVQVQAFAAVNASIAAAAKNSFIMKKLLSESVNSGIFMRPTMEMVPQMSSILWHPRAGEGIAVLQPDGQISQPRQNSTG
jgi:hypothetical protein